MPLSKDIGDIVTDICDFISKNARPLTASQRSLLAGQLAVYITQPSPATKCPRCGLSEPPDAAT